MSAKIPGMVQGYHILAYSLYSVRGKTRITFYIELIVCLVSFDNDNKQQPHEM